MFVIGQKVKVISGSKVGQTGKICKIEDGLFGVWLDVYDSSCHDCGGSCLRGHGWNMNENQIEAIPEPPKVEEKKIRNEIKTGIKMNSIPIMTNEVMKELKSLKEYLPEKYNMKVKTIEYTNCLKTKCIPKGTVLFLNFVLPDVDDVCGIETITLDKKTYHITTNGGSLLLISQVPEDYEKTIFDDEGNLLAVIEKRQIVYTAFSIDKMQNTKDNKDFLSAFFEKLKKEGFAPIDRKSRNKNERKAIQGWLARIVNQKLSKAKSRLVDAESATAEFQRRFIEQLRLVDQTNKEIKTLEKDKKNTSDIKELFSKLFQNPKIKRIWHDKKSDLLCFETVPLKIESCKTGKTYDIGRYKIMIGLDGRIIADTLDANKALIEDIQHPHVHSKRICWGNIGESVSKLMADWKIDVVLMLTIRLLERYNSDSPYMSLNDFMDKGFGKHVTCEPKY